MNEEVKRELKMIIIQALRKNSEIAIGFPYIVEMKNRIDRGEDIAESVIIECV